MSKTPRTVEDYYWFWPINGFKGLFGMINKPLNEGHRPPDDFWKELEEQRDELNKILARK